MLRFLKRLVLLTVVAWLVNAGTTQLVLLDGVTALASATRAWYTNVAIISIFEALLFCGWMYLIELATKNKVKPIGPH